MSTPRGFVAPRSPIGFVVVAAGDGVSASWHAEKLEGKGVEDNATVSGSRYPTEVHQDGDPGGAHRRRGGGL